MQVLTTDNLEVARTDRLLRQISGKKDNSRLHVPLLRDMALRYCTQPCRLCHRSFAAAGCMMHHSKVPPNNCRAKRRGFE